MIIEFYPEKIGLSRRSPHRISGGGRDRASFRIVLKPGLNDLKPEQVEQLHEFQNYFDKGALVIREEAQTNFSRTHELEQLYEDQGYQPISKLATEYGIAKPSTGWKDAIPLIVKYEQELLEEMA